MIFTDRIITVRKGESKINEPIIIYRGDYELEVRFTIMNSKFKFMSATNLIESENAAYGQLAILTPYGGNIFSVIAKCNEGTVTFVLTKAMLDQIEEVGLYSFQIRLFDYNKESRVSIPPVEFGIEVREPITSEDHDNSVNNAIVGYSIAKIADALNEKVPDTFNSNGDYNKTIWDTGDRITEGRLNKIEDALDKINQNEKNDVASLDKRVTNNFNVLDSAKAELNELKVLETRVDSLVHLREGSTTGDAELIDARIEYNGAVNATVGGAIRKQISNIHDTLDDVISKPNLYSTAPVVHGKYFDYGTEKEGNAYSYFKVEVQVGVTYYMYPRIRLYCMMDYSGKVVDRSIEVNEGMFSYTPSISGFLYVTIFTNDLETLKMATTSDMDSIGKYGELLTLSDKISLYNHKDIKDIYNHIDSYSINDMRDDINKLQKYVIDNNLLTHSPCVDEYYFTSFSSITADNDYCYYKVNLKADVTYHMYPRIRIIRAYKKGSITSIFFDNSDCNNNKPYEFTPNMDCEAYVTFFIDDKHEAFISEESDPDLVTKTGTMLLNPNVVVESVESAANQSNVLYKKKWAVIGDSFTAGDFSGYADANGLTGKNSPELYDVEFGMYKTYPWWIMKRNDMIIQKFYQGGRTLATPADGTFTNSITYNDMYKQIDADVDYITIYLGINDGHHMPGSTGDDGEDTSGSIPIGTETDETTATFYGAWNVLLRDLITLYPFAHIGILVSNGMDTDEHVNATIKMAKKWGIPYLNLDSGYDVPLLLRSRPNCRPETCAEAIELRRSQQRVSSSNGHPNHLAHKYESTFIEDFLRRI